MTLEVCEKNRIAYYWLSREEKDNVDIQNGLKNEYGEWRSKGYKVCTFVSGSGNLVDLTKELLIHFLYLRLLYVEKAYLFSLKNNIPYLENLSGIINYSCKFLFVELIISLLPRKKQ